MNQKVCRLWNLTVVAVIFYLAYSILINFRLISDENCHERSTTTKKPIEPKLPTPVVIRKVLPIEENIGKIDINLGRHDNKLEYKFYDNVFVGTNFMELSKIHKTCLATQSSLEKLSSIINVISHWEGPISLAVFGAEDEEFNKLLMFVIFLRQCYSKIRNQVNFHFAFPVKHAPQKIFVNESILNHLNCDNPLGVLAAFVKFKAKRKYTRWKGPIPYPQNHMRNLARKNCQSEYVFLTDVDIVPSNGMVYLLDDFLAKNVCFKKLCAFVIPTFELDDRVRFPTNKSELLRLARKDLARPFHHKVFIYNQFATNFSRWQESTADSYEVYVSHPVTNFEFLYEPFYVAKDTVPPHDERFIGYGYTRNTQVYEMFVAGYEFLVLSPIFTVHWGLQVKKSRPTWREQQNSKNMKLFDGFKRELLAKYRNDPLNMLKKKKRP